MLEQNRMSLREIGLKMFELCQLQLKWTQEAFFSVDHDLAEKVIHFEKRVNALDIRIDRECERFLALHQPVANDLRFVLGLRKVNFGLERIGDCCFGISKYTAEMEELPKADLLLKLRIEEMFETTMAMMEDISIAFQEGDDKRARKAFKKEQILNEIYRKSFPIILEEAKRNIDSVDQCLVLFSIIKKIESTGDIIIGIAEEIIFYCQAEIWRHQLEKFEWD